MDVRKGLSVDGGSRWTKLDVQVDEADLARICAEHGISQAYRDQMTVVMVWLLQDTLGEWLLQSGSVQLLDGDARAGAQERATRARMNYLYTVDRVKESLGIPARPATQPEAPASASAS